MAAVKEVNEAEFPDRFSQATMRGFLGVEKLRTPPLRREATTLDGVQQERISCDAIRYALSAIEKESQGCYRC
jgi:hypothetical protein